MMFLFLMQEIILKVNIITKYTTSKFLNELKFSGYRYELFCISKSTKTTQCTLHCDTNSEMAWQFNTSRQDQYSREIFDALVMRFEAPDGRNRWDSPLFTIQSDDELPFKEIAASLYERKAPKPNQSTQSVRFLFFVANIYLI